MKRSLSCGVVTILMVCLLNSGCGWGTDTSKADDAVGALPAAKSSPRADAKAVYEKAIADASLEYEKAKAKAATEAQIAVAAASQQAAIDAAVTKALDEVAAQAAKEGETSRVTRRKDVLVIEVPVSKLLRILKE